MTNDVQPEALIKKLGDRIDQLEQATVHLWTKADVAETRLKRAKREVRSQKDKNQPSSQEYRKKELVSAAKIAELELKLVDSDNKNGTERDNRKAELAIRLSNAYRDLLEIEKAEKNKLKADFEAKKRPS